MFRMFSALFGAISALFNSIVGLTDTVDKGIGMLDRFVTDEAEKQSLRSDFEVALFEETFEAEYAKKLDLARAGITAYIGQSNERAEGFHAAMADLQAVVEKRQASRKSKEDRL